MASGTVRYWAAAKGAAGVAEETVEADTLASLLDVLRRREPARPRLVEVLRVSSFIVDTKPVGTRLPESVRLGDGWVVEVLPPFAGG
jgi:molybdopterin converting factor small subunit